MDAVDVGGGRNVIVVRATPDPGAVPYTYDGRAYERIGTTTRRMAQERYHRLLLQREAAASRWENQPADGIASSDLDATRVRALARDITPRPPAREPLLRLLERLDVVEDGRPLRAAVVLFAKHPPPHYPQCELQVAAGIRSRVDFQQRYLGPLLERGLLEMTIPEKPRSHAQRYRLTPAGRRALQRRTPT